MRFRPCCLLGLIATLALLLPELHGGGEEFKSGLGPGRLIGGPFLPYTLNDRLTKAERAKARKEEKDDKEIAALTGRFHCMVCEYGLKPVVAIFVREDPDAKADANEGAVQELLKKVDEAVERHQASYLNSFVIFLTPEARSSITEKKEEDTEKLVTEAVARAKLTERLTPLANSLNHVVVGFFPAENLKGWDIAKQPGVTVMVYAKHKVLANHAFAEGKLKSAEVEQVIKGVDALFKKTKKKSPQP